MHTQDTTILKKHENDLGDGDTFIVTLASLMDGKFSVRVCITHDGCEPLEGGTTIYRNQATAEAAFLKALV